MEVPINYLAVLASALSAIALGALWYGPVFGKKWQHYAGLSLESMKAMKMTPMQAMFGGALVSLLMAYVLAHALVFGNAYLGSSGVAAGLMCAFWYWLGFAVPLTSGVFLWEGKSWKLWALHAGYYFVSLMLMGAILGGWQ